MEKHDILMKVTGILDMYCEDCLLYHCNKQEEGKRQAHRFCLQSCTIGKKLQSYGKKLM
ncbi:hypothetical protein CIB95_08290 [Lottiidibacillus patelloidae]|uniref:Zinc-finger domain-containing protein n=1 Tax=Lottiidibacillus patelloidae TaxID=2670334 RepID=A0A263BUN6_9BACI|nr:hypothetical protein CIB95_08290 [Lottiidibacillus patelloidae]